MRDLTRDRGAGLKAYSYAMKHGASTEQAKVIAERAFREARADERNGRLFRGAGDVFATADGGFRLYTYTGRVIDPLAPPSIDTASTLD